MKNYHDLLRHVLENGRFKGDRTGTGTISVFGYQMRFDLQAGFPLVSTKKVHTKSIIRELLWFLRGETNIAYLKEHGVKIWDEWATEEGELGPIYGKQWRSWAVPPDLAAPIADKDPIDQIAEAVHLLRTKPDSRRIIVSAWNPADLPDESVSPQENVADNRMALAACHTMFQFYSAEATLSERINESDRMDVGEWSTAACAARGWTRESWEDRESATVHEYLDSLGVPRRILSCQLYQRSADCFLGVPFNIASYALLTHMMAQVTDHMAGEFVHTFGDAHIYSNHMEQVREQLSRKPYPLPRLRLNPAVKEIDDFTFDDIEFVGYQHHAPIKGAVAV